MALQIAGTIALVTGANRGIGRALVEALLERGAARVYATARRLRRSATWLRATANGSFPCASMSHVRAKCAPLRRRPEMSGW